MIPPSLSVRLLAGVVVLPLLLDFGPTASVQAFVPNTADPQRRRHFVVSAQRNEEAKTSSGHDGDDHHHHHHLEGIEQARQSFEELMKDQDVSSQVYDNNNNNNKSNNHEDDVVLTTVGRRRRQLEMALLDSLRDSNDGLEELLHLWITESGDDEAAQQILDMERNCSTGLVRELEWLTAMTRQHPTWAEPVMRLAVVYFYKGRTDEAYQTALHALQLKPWHIEAPQLLIMICLRNQDLKQALYWARRSLPRMVSSESGEFEEGNSSWERFLRRRKAWVDGAMEQAQLQWDQAEERSRQGSLSSVVEASSSPSQTGSSSFGNWQ